jgi:hypothetical protein
MQTLIKSIERAAEVLALDPEELQLWLEQYPNLAPYTQIQLLRMATKHKLDPLSDEIAVMETLDGYQAFITIDGWVKLINNHEQFAGMSLREPQKDQPSEKETLEWMECTIYRHDRILPIVVKEYLDEVKTNHPSWQQMPRRMLRHRVIQQCARLALGIGDRDFVAKVQSNSTNYPKNKNMAASFNSYEFESSKTNLLKNIMKESLIKP